MSSASRALDAWLGTLYPYQRAWVGGEAPFAVLVKARQIGLSHATAAACVWWGLVHRRPQLLLSASQVLSDEVLSKARAHCALLADLGLPAALDLVTDSSREMAWRSGGRIVALPANPRTARSFSGDVWLDELAYYQDAQGIWDAAGAIATRGKYRVRVCSTPNGAAGLFYDLASSPPEGWVSQRVTLADAIAQGCVVDLAKCRALAGGDERLWSQWYECSFLDARLQYLPTELVERALAWEGDLPRLDDAEIHAGLDVGREHDLTALTVVAVVRETAWHLATLTWKRTAFADQRDGLEAARERFGWDSLTVDATGLGTQLAEELQERWGSYEVRPLTFTPAVKERLYTRLYRWLAGDRLRLARGDDGEHLRGEAVALQRVVTASGGISYEVPRGRDGHGDRLTSLALALDGAGEPVLPVTLGQRPLTAVA